MKRRIIAAVSILAILGLTGCGDEPFEEASVSAAELEAEAEAAFDDKWQFGHYGTECAEEITDQLGTYCHLSVGITDPVEIASSVEVGDYEARGFTPDVVAGLHFKAVNFYISEYLDSTALDAPGPNAGLAWAQANRGLFAPGMQDKIDTMRDPVLNRFLPELIRDGGPRGDAMRVDGGGVSGTFEKFDDDSIYIKFVISGAADYRVSDGATVTWMLNGNHEAWPEENDPIPTTEEEIVAAFPWTNDGNENVFSFTTTLEIGYDVNGLITGYQPEIVETAFYGAGG